MIIEESKSVFWKVIEYSFCCFIILFPFLNYSGFLYSGTSTRAVNLFLLSSAFGIGLAVWLLGQKSNFSIPKSPIFLGLILYLIFLFVSAFWGLSFSNSFWSLITRTTGLWYFLNLGFLMVMLWPILSDRKKQDKVILLTIISTALYSVLSFLGPEGVNLIFKSYPFDGFTFGNSSFAGMYLFGVFILALYYLLKSSTKKWWMYLLPILVVISPNILNSHIFLGDFSSGFLGEARASSYVVLLSLPILFGLWLVSKIKNNNQKTILSYLLFVCGIIAMLVSAYSLLSPDGLLRQFYLSQATAVRPIIWQMSEVAIKQRPVLGWGSDNFERVFEKKYDNRILEDRYGNEAWFDRAHNIFVDQAISSGFLGLILYFIVYSVIILSLIFSALKSVEREDKILAVLLIVYFSLHLLELQTAFDTSISYIILGLLTVLAALLFHRTISVEDKNSFTVKVNLGVKYLLAIGLLIYFSVTIFWGLVPLIQAQIVNGKMRTVGSAEKRIPLYPVLFGSPVDKHAFIWRTTTDFQRGIASNPQVLQNPQDFKYLKEELAIFEAEYKNYVTENPNHFRAHLGLADILIYSMLFQINKLEEAQQVLDQAIVLVPQSPQAYWMKAVAYVYMNKFDLARDYANKGLALNPNIRQSQEIVDYVERSAKTFPEIDLFFFKQI